MSRPARFTLPIEVEIRACEAGDLDKLEWFGAFTHHRQVIREAFALQQAGEVVMLVAVTGGFPVGQAWLVLRLKPGAQAPAVWAVRVIEPLQGAGLGARLMAALEAAARERGVNALELGVETGNPAARRFYERLGWRLVRERRDSYGYVTPDGRAVTHALHEWVLAKRLDQASPTRA
jgi:GNAT superfamily N-acetyltransferase